MDAPAQGYVHLRLTPELLRLVVEEKGGINIQVKLDEEGVIVDAFSDKDDEAIASTWKLYSEFEEDE